MGAVRGGRGTRSMGRSLPATAVLALAVLATFLPLAGGATTLRAYVLADATTVDPGDVVQFTVILDNQGPAVAAWVWVNLTLPASTVYDSDSGLPPFNCVLLPVVGNLRQYECQNRPQANESFWVRYRVLAGPADGAVLTATLAVNYTDEAGALQAEVRSSASVTMSIPAFTVSKTPLANPVDPGDALVYLVAVQNTGSAAASRVWANDTLPPEVTFGRTRNHSFPPAWCSAEDCELRSVGPGDVETYEVEVAVGASVPRGIAFANRVFLNFTDNDGSHVVGTGFAEAWVETRIIRDLTLDKAADATLVYPGARVTFTIWYNNTATAALGAAWINDTLPVGLVYNASAPNGAHSGGVVRWQFPSVATGENALTLVAVVAPGTANGTVLTNTVVANYRDAAGIPGIPEVASTSVTVSTDLPRFDTFTKVAAAAEAARGSTVRFTIHFNNTGTANATEVVVADTIPPGTTLTNPSAAPDSTSGRTFTWRFVDVAPGPHLLSYDLVLQDVAEGATILNEARLTYLGPTGQPLPPVPPRSATVRVLAGPVQPAGSWLPAILAVVALLGVAGFVAYRFLARPGTVIDEVFLLHKDGLLIKHFTRRIRPDVDSDILSGMLIAVQNFVNESFIGSEGLQKEGQLDELRFGQFKMVIERGQWVIVAAVLSGDPTNRVKEEVKAAIQSLEADLGTKLDGWQGDMRSVEGADRYMQDLIEGAYRKFARGKG